MIIRNLSREKPQGAQSQKWDAIPYGDYLIAVDDVLVSRYGRDSTEEEMAYVAECQEAGCTPSECARSIVFDDWVVRSGGFF